MSPKSNEVLATEMTNLANEVHELKGRFDNFSSNFVRNDLYTLKHQELETHLTTLEAQVADLRRAKWLLTLFGIVIGSVAAFLIQYALTH